MKKKVHLILILCTFSLGLYAQSGKNYLQVSGQICRPTSAMLEVTNFGYGGAIKWMHGFSEYNQQVTFEAGYNRFPVKKLPDGVQANYAAVPIYVGYRYLANKVSLELQAGTSVNRIVGRNAEISLSETKLNLGLGLGIGYVLKNFEFGARYQVTDVRGTRDDPTFLSLKLAYNILL
ncbi:outer membrane beta-barrel protein [Pedobacter miscanthi]|jgi:hypothetical protein|uniref:outer membrane beta-barrel protein n=1 Tax=Pedobacter miscanthi TaxID=2259170 RepID=UPI00292D0C92|nr:outer membrane beta-barrel protein [Pedobacter miscanthi]